MPAVNILNLQLSQSGNNCYVNWTVRVTCNTQECADVQTTYTLNFDIIGVDVVKDDAMGTHPGVAAFNCDPETNCVTELEGTTPVPCGQFNEDWGTDELQFRFFVTRPNATGGVTEVGEAITHDTWE